MTISNGQKQTNTEKLIAHTDKVSEVCIEQKKASDNSVAAATELKKQAEKLSSTIDHAHQ